MKRILVVAALIAGVFVVGLADSARADGHCTATSSLREAHATCSRDPAPDASGSHVSNAGSKKRDVKIEPICTITTDTTCGALLNCTTAAGTQGTYYSHTVDGVPQPNICLGPAEATEAGIVTTADVQRAWHNLTWPASDLNIEPPDAITLVNFDTNLYTTNTTPTRQDITLLGQPITIEATPTTWTWTHGDGTRQTTTDPGAPYPQLRVTHNYRRTGNYDITLATTYTGRYRTSTDSAWQTIPDPLTITSPPQAIRAIEAQPKLVGH